jgi:hypothetical protein
MAGIHTTRAARRAATIGIAALAAVALATGCGGSSSGSAGSPSSSSTAPPLPPPPAGFKLKQVGVTVHLRWKMPGGAGATGFKITRGGVMLDTLTGTSFVDTNVTPGRRYVYRVISIDGAGQSRPALAQIKVSKPPLTAARLSGLYNVTARTTSDSGFAHLTGHATFAWTFTPSCSAGPCNVHWVDNGGFSGQATRSGTSYSLSFTGFMGVTCNGTHAQSTATAHFRVTKAEAVDGHWKVTRIRGTLDVETPAQLGCVSSSNVQDLAARFVA